MDRAIQFGRYHLDPAQGLTRGMQEVRITPKSLAVLLTLVQRPGQIVTKDELFRAVWPDTVVSDSTLTSCIQELRQALRDDARHPQFIETLHRRGFRFLAPLSRRRQAPPRAIVGRGAALRQLANAAGRAREGERQLVFVTGEPGIGKTATVEHFFAGLGDGDEWWTSRAACVEHYGAGEAFQPLLEALTRLCRQADGASVIAALERCAPSWLVQLPALLTPAALAALERRTAGVTQQRMLRELNDAIEAMAASRPVALCLEDLHWSDASTLDWIASFARRPEHASVLLVGTYRPGEAADPLRSPQAVADELCLKRLCTAIALERLDERAVAEYVATRFPPASDTETRLAGLARRIHRHSEGNPLFLVNILDDLVTRNALKAQGDRWSVGADLDAESLSIPGDVRRAIERQAERLADDERLLLDVASILGGPCCSAAIAAGTGVPQCDVETALAGLARRNLFVRALPALEWPDGTVSATFDFLHALYREVVSEYLSPARRAQFHGLVGTRLEAAYGDRAPEIAAELAVHFDAARDFPRAIAYLQHAAETDRRRTAHDGAQRHYRRALTLLGKMPESEQRDQREVAIQIGLGSVLMQISGWGASEVEEVFSRARGLCEKHGWTSGLFSALWNLWVSFVARGRFERARALADSLFELATRSADPSQLLQAHHARWTTLFSLGSLCATDAHACEGMKLYEPDRTGAQIHAFGSHDTGVCARLFRARSLVLQGRSKLAVQMSDEAVTQARELNHPFTLALALTHAAAVRQECGDAVATREYATAARTIACEQGFNLLLGWSTCFLGWALAQLEDRKRGLGLIHEGISGARATGSEMFLGQLLGMFACTQLKFGLVAEAERSIDEAFAVSERNGERTYIAELHRLRGELCLAAEPGSLAVAERDFRAAIEAARAQGAGLFTLRAAIGLARRWHKSGRSGEARAWMEEARAPMGGESSLPEQLEANELLAAR